MAKTSLSRIELKEICVNDWIYVAINNTKKYYSDLGYKIVEYEGKKKFKIHPWDLPRSSHQKVLVTCYKCKKERFVEFRTLNSNICKCDLSGRVFGRLTVLEYAKKLDKVGHKYWLCQCTCGNKKVIQGSNLIQGDTTSCGCFHREQTSTASNKNHRTKGHWVKIDHTDEENTAYENEASNFYVSSKWKELRKIVLKRDNHKCKVTGKTGDLVVHHIFLRKDYPNLAYDLNNLITLNRTIHSIYHNTVDEVTDSTFLMWAKSLEVEDEC